MFERLHRTLARFLILTAFLGIAAAAPTAAQSNYIAVGDSLAYGFRDFTATPTGPTGVHPAYAGYTQAVTQYLAAQTGARGTFTGLGIVGETTGTLIGSPNDASENPSLNSYYTTPETQLMALQAELAAHPDSLVTIQDGANDFLALATDTAFQTAVATGDTATEQSLILGTASTVASNYVPLLAAVKADPQARVLILGDYNPYATLLQDNPAQASNPVYQYLAGVAPSLLGALNTTLAATSAGAGYQFVDVQSAFSSYAGTDPLVLDTESVQTAYGDLPNIHPTDAGYALIAGQVDRALAPAPEPSQTVALGLGVLGLAGLALKARKRGAA